MSYRQTKVTDEDSYIPIIDVEYATKSLEPEKWLSLLSNFDKDPESTPAMVEMAEKYKTKDYLRMKWIAFNTRNAAFTIGALKLAYVCDYIWHDDCWFDQYDLNILLNGYPCMIEAMIEFQINR